MQHEIAAHQGRSPIMSRRRSRHKRAGRIEATTGLYATYPTLKSTPKVPQ